MQAALLKQAVGHFIVYGIEGKQSDVSSDVYDNPFTVENHGKMTFNTDVETEQM